MRHSNLESAILIMGSRLICMVIGLAGIPLLLHTLGLQGFGAWAVLLGGSVAFYTLEIGMTPTVVKFITEAEERREPSSTSRILTNAMVLLSGIFLAGFAGLVLVAEPLATWLKLPDTPLLSRSGLLLFVFAAVSLSSLVKMGVNTLHAARRFDLVALVSLFHSLIPNVVAWTIAILTQRLDLVLLGFWVSQFLVLLAAHHFARTIMPWRFNFRLFDRHTIRPMLFHGLNLQFSDLAHVVHFQFDKMIIAGLVALSEVAHYEVGSRAGMALRSMCSSGLGTLLPTVTKKVAGGGDIWPLYLEATRAATHLAIIFLLVPLVVSPLFLFAWVGLIGYHGRWVFMILAVGISVHVIALPVSIFIQALGRTFLEACVAACSVVLNVGFSLVLVKYWAKEGAAAGTSLAMVLTGIGYLYLFHRMQQRSLRHTVQYLFKACWPALLVCAVCLAAVHLLTPLVIHTRWLMAPTSVGLYGSAILTLLVIYARIGEIGESEQNLIGMVPGLRWILRLAESKKR